MLLSSSSDGSQVSFFRHSLAAISKCR
jgi:hypothetical protein